MNVYKLKYTDKATAIADLKAKGVLNEEGNYTSTTHAVVHLGNIILTPATESDEAVISDKHHLDVMVENTIDFGDAEIVLNSGESPIHKFL